MSVPRATVVVCTHDRADVLATAVTHAHAQARALGAEVLVVDNASTDGTPALLADLGRRLGAGLRSVHEPELGLSAARNRGLAEARGAVVVYLDDDAVPRPGWLAALLAGFDDPDVVAAGGRIVLRFPGAAPAWLDPTLHGQLSAYDQGPAAHPIRYGQADYPYGANIAFRADAARARGGFSRLVGPRGRHQLVHDETDLCYRLEHAGGTILYLPDAVVDHVVLPERISPAWMLRRASTGGQSAAVFILRNRGVLRALWRLRWLYGASFLTLPYAPREPIDAGRFARECRRREAWGYLRGLLRAMPRLRALRSAA
ncbi:MAG: glycosyltransferase family 2 protein [bacterium]|nr:glycosyltransferase family 2 protein [bacterium]